MFYLTLLSKVSVIYAIHACQCLLIHNVNVHNQDDEYFWQKLQFIEIFSCKQNCRR